MPHLTVTYKFGGPSDAPENSGESIPPLDQQACLHHVNDGTSSYPNLMELVLSRFAAIAGEKVTKAILHQVGREIGAITFTDSDEHPHPDRQKEALDRAMSTYGLGRLVGLKKSETSSSLTYECTVKGCHDDASPSPACNITHGIVAHWLEAFHQRGADGIETDWGNDEAEPCTFRLTFRKT